VLDKLSVDDFSPAIGGRFVLALDGAEPIDLELVSARTHEDDAPALDESGTRSPFFLRFRGPGEPLLPQSIYRIENDHTGPLEIFLVPIANDGTATTYEAVFA
jgi:hypothetical protein